MVERLILLAGLLMWAGTLSAAPLVDGKVDAGKARAAACAACHGPKGNKQSKQFPKLAGQAGLYIYEQLKYFKSGKRKNAIMAGQAAGLSDQDMQNVAAYFASQQTQPGVADPTIAPAGAAIYRGGLPDKQVPACSGCHGPSGLGNAAAKFPRLSGQNPQYIVTQLEAYRSGKRSGYHRASIMNGVAQNLSDTEIKALASYVTGLEQAGKNEKNSHGALMQKASAKAAQGASGSGGGQQGKTKTSQAGKQSGAAASAGAQKQASQVKKQSQGQKQGQSQSQGQGQSQSQGQKQGQGKGQGQDQGQGQGKSRGQSQGQGKGQGQPKGQGQNQSSGQNRAQSQSPTKRQSQAQRQKPAQSGDAGKPSGSSGGAAAGNTNAAAQQQPATPNPQTSADADTNGRDRPAQPANGGQASGSGADQADRTGAAKTNTGDGAAANPDASPKAE